jgi:hypothetical protein
VKAFSTKLKKRHHILSAVLFTLACILLFRFLLVKEPQENAVGRAEPEQPLPMASLTPTPTLSPAKVMTPERVTPSSSTHSLESILPTTQTLRTEVAKDPHAPAPSMIRFSLQLGERLEDCQSHPEKVPAFFSELKNCVSRSDANITVTLRAICLSTAQQLTEVSPSLKTNFLQLVKESSPDVVERAHVAQSSP